MPRDKSESHEKIIAAAYEEFLTYGFVDASMRRIAAACDMSASGLYRHYPSKEEMFAALVEPAYQGLKDAYLSSVETEMGELDEIDIQNLWKENGDTVWAIRFIYEHYNAFKLLVCRSQGTRFENFVHDFAVLEEKVTNEYFQKLRKLGIKVNKIPKKEYHLFLTTNLHAIFLPIEHDMTEKEALSYARHMDAFYLAGWKELLGLNN